MSSLEGGSHRIPLLQTSRWILQLSSLPPCRCKFYMVPTCCVWFKHWYKRSLPPVTAVCSGNHNLVCPYPWLRHCQQWAECGLIRPISQLFLAAFDKLQLNRTTLTSKRIKKVIKPINYAHINIFHKKGYLFKIRMEFLRPILANIELIYQQPAMSQ